MSITILTFNGLNNRLGVVISALRLARKTNRILNLCWPHTPVRSCLAYFGEYCKFQDLFDTNMDNVIIDGPYEQKYLALEIQEEGHRLYEFKYWDKKDHVIDVKGNDHIYVNWALYPLISLEDESELFCNLKKSISFPREIIFDKVGEELSETFKTMKPVPELQKEIEQCYKDQFFIGTEKKNILGLHLRCTDGSFTEIKWNLISDKLIKLCQGWNKKSPKNAIFLATDSLDIYIKFLEKLGSQLIVYTPPKILGNVSSVTKFENDKYNVLCGLIEMNLLGKSTIIIGTVNSTFSICSMLLADPKIKKYLIDNVDNIPSILD